MIEEYLLVKPVAKKSLSVIFGDLALPPLKEGNANTIASEGMHDSYARDYIYYTSVKGVSIFMKCWFDADGNLINIGEWDTQPEQVEVQAEKRDEEGNLISPAVYETVERNPLPDGAYYEEREVIQTADGGLVLAEDYAALRRAAYPGYSPFDLIDEILKVIDIPPGSKLEEIQQQRLDVKATYPKPEGSIE